jgi:hypothetical protein
MNTISFLSKMGLSVTLSSVGKIKLSGLRGINEKLARKAIKYAKDHKAKILSELTKSKITRSAINSTRTLEILSGDCEKCPAGGYWDWKGPGLWCFYTAYFLGKSATPISCYSTRINCPLIRI